MLDKLKAKLSEKAQNLVNDIKVPEEVREQRYQKCISCEKFVPKINMCSMCGCIMPVKTWLAQSSCPIKKWDIHQVNDL